MKTSLIFICITLVLSVFAADNNTDYVSQVPVIYKVQLDLFLGLA